MRSLFPATPKSWRKIFGRLKTACFTSAFSIAMSTAAAAQGLTVVHDFAGYQTESGAAPYTALIQGTDGNFYGTTSSGGGGGCTVPHHL